MTSNGNDADNTAGGNRILGSLRAVDGKGIVRMEDRFDAAIDDLWATLTDPRRLARWLGEVEGDLRLGGEYHFRFLVADRKAPGVWKRASRRGGCSWYSKTTTRRTTRSSRPC